ARGGAVLARFLDVGQGDSTLIVTSDRHALLVDAGPPDGAPHVEAALRDLGSAVLDAVVLSHPHADHLGALDQLARDLPFATWIDPGFDRHTFAPYARALDACRERNIPI